MNHPVSFIVTLALLAGIGAPGRFETRDSYESGAGNPNGSSESSGRNEPLKLLTSQTPCFRQGQTSKPAAMLLALPVVHSRVGQSMTNSEARGELWSAASSSESASGGDGISLITIADSFENESCCADSTTGRTRVFFDSETGAIKPPKPTSASTLDRDRKKEQIYNSRLMDQAVALTDLEATFTHEVGHSLRDSTTLPCWRRRMQSRQAFNGTFGLPALTERTLVKMIASAFEVCTGQRCGWAELKVD